MTSRLIIVFRKSVTMEVAALVGMNLALGKAIRTAYDFEIDPEGRIVLCAMRGTGYETTPSVISGAVSRTVTPDIAEAVIVTIPTDERLDTYLLYGLIHTEIPDSAEIATLTLTTLMKKSDDGYSTGSTSTDQYSPIVRHFLTRSLNTVIPS